MVSARLDRWVVSLMSLVAFLTALSNYSVQPFLPVMADDLGSSVPLIGQAATVPLFVAAIVGLVAGPLADFLGFKQVAITGLALIAVSALGAGLATSFEVLLLARVLAGLGAAATVAITFALVGAVHGRPVRQRALSYVAAAFSVSAVVGIPLLTAVARVVGWRGAMFCIAAGGFGLAFVLWRYMINPPDRPVSPVWPGALPIARSYIPLLADRRMMLVFAGIAGIGMGTIGAVTYIGAYFVEEIGMSAGRIGLLFALAGGSYTFGSILGGMNVVDFRSRGISIGLALGSGTAIGAMFGLSPAALAAAAMVAVALVAAGTLNVMLVTALSYEAKSGAATTMAMQASVTNLGSAVGVAIGGLMLSLGGYPALGLFAGLSFIAAGFVTVMRFTIIEREEPERGARLVGNLRASIPGEGEQR